MDPAHISRLKEEQEQYYQETQAKIQQWKKFDADYSALQDRLKTLPDKVTHSIMVPFGPLAFMPGELIHTNEIMVLLGDNWFAERSAKQACQIVDRRKEEIKTSLSDLEKQSRLLADRLGFTSEFKDLSENKGDIVEIKEDYDPQKEKLWREERQRKKPNSRKPSEHHKKGAKEPVKTSPSDTKTATQRKEQTMKDKKITSPAKSPATTTSQEAKTKSDLGQSSKVKETENQDDNESQENKRQREEEALWARLDALEKQEEELDELARLSDYDEEDEEEYDNQPMFSYIKKEEKEPSTQPHKPLIRSDSADKKVKWKDQQEDSSSGGSSDDELPTPAVIHFTHTKGDIEQKPKPSESEELTSPADIYQHYLTQQPSEESQSSVNLSAQSTSPHQLKSIMKPPHSPEPVAKKPAKEILPQLDSVFSGTIVESKAVPMVTPADNQSVPDAPVKRVSKFKAARQQKR